MTRRSVLAAGLAVLLLAPEYSAAQQSQAKIPRVGILTQASSDRAPMFDAFREGLRDLGYVEGRNITLEFRLAHGDLARGLAAGGRTAGTPGRCHRRGRHPPRGSGSERACSDRLPGYAGSCPARIRFQPRAAGSEHHGLHPHGYQLNAKRLELLHTAFPHITAVAALVNPSSGPQIGSRADRDGRAVDGSGNVKKPRLRASRPCARCARRSSPEPTR